MKLLRAEFHGSPEVPCVKCDRRERGLAWGDFCSQCLKERSGRASRLASRISRPVVLLMGLYLAWKIPVTPGARVYAIIAVVGTYALLWKIVHTIAMEFLPR